MRFSQNHSHSGYSHYQQSLLYVCNLHALYLHTYIHRLLNISVILITEIPTFTTAMTEYTF